MANKTATPAKKPVTIPPVVMVIGAVLAAGVAGFIYLENKAKQPPPEPPKLTGPAKEYVKYLQFVSKDGQTAESPQMTAHDSYMKLSVVEITGNIRNSGNRVLELVEINCVFTDPYGAVLLRERVPIVSKKMGKLVPGETKPFRLAFDNVPESWNQAMPQMVIARIDFE